MPGSLVNGLKLVPKRGGPKDRTSYCDIIRPKLLAAVDNRSTKFTFPDKPMSSGKSNVVIYTRCSHNDKRSGIFFEKRNLIIGEPLALSFANECKQCDGSAGKISNSVNGDIGGNEQFGDLINVIKEGLSDLMQKIQSECLNSDDPIKHFYHNYARFGIDANKVFITVAKEIQPPSPANVTATPPVNNAEPSLTQITTEFELQAPLASDADMHPLSPTVAELDNLLLASITPLDAEEPPLTIPSRIAATIPTNLSSTNSSGYQQLTTFSAAINAPVLVFSADADGEQQLTPLIPQ